MAKPVMLSKEEFCEKTHTTPNGWLFEKAGPDYSMFEYAGFVYFDDGNGELRRFKDMKEYGEIWSSVKKVNDGVWSIWSTWKEYS